MSKIIVIANQKGGVGKTTTSVNLAASLGVLEKKVLLIDTDPQGNASFSLGIEVEKITSEMNQYLSQSFFDQNCIITSNSPNLDIIPALNLSSRIKSVNEDQKRYVLKQAIKYLRSAYDYVIIDCSPSLDWLLLNALVIADSVLIPIQCEYYALEGLGKLLKTIKSTRKSFNTSLDIEGILLTMYDSRLRTSTQIVKQIHLYFRDMVFQTIIHRNVRLGEAPNFGKSIINYDISSKGAENYLSLAKEVLNRNEVVDVLNGNSVLGKQLSDIIQEGSPKEDINYIFEKNGAANGTKNSTPALENDHNNIASLNYKNLLGLNKLEVKQKLGQSFNDMNSNIWMYRIRDKFKITKKNYLYIYFFNDKVQHYAIKRLKNSKNEFNLRHLINENLDLSFIF